MIKWLISLWTSAFIKTVSIGGNKVLVSIDFGAYMVFWSVFMVVLGIALGTFGTLVVMKIIGRLGK